MGKFFDAKVLIWKNDAEKKLSALRFLEDLSCNQLARDDDDMNVDKEINLDVEAVQQYKYFSTDAHERCVEIMDETKRQLGESLNTDDVLFSAIQNLKGDDITSKRAFYCLISDNTFMFSTFCIAIYSC